MLPVIVEEEEEAVQHQVILDRDHRIRFLAAAVAAAVLATADLGVAIQQAL